MVVMMVVMVMLMAVFVLVSIGMVVLIVPFLFVVVLVFYGSNPRSGGRNLVEIEVVCPKNALKIHVSVVTFYYFGFRLQCPYNLAHLLQLFGRHVIDFVQQHNVAEFYLLYQQVLYVVFLQILLHEVVSSRKLVAHTACIHHGNNVSEHCYAVFCKVGIYLWIGADGLCDGRRFANAACLNHDVVETVLLYDVAKLLYQVHFKRAADATVLQCHQRIVLLVYHATFFYQVGIYVYFANIVYNYSELDAFVVAKNFVYECSLTASEIPCKQ